MVIRRYCDPINIKHLWDAIRSINLAHQICDSQKIYKYLQKITECSVSQVELHIKQALKDKLILTGKKNAEGVPQTFRITDQELPELDGKDWYCFECHLAGEVTPCAKCFRVYHIDCIKGAKRRFESYQSRRNVDQGLDSSRLNLSSSDLCVSSSKGRLDNHINDLIYDENLCSICNIMNNDKECQLSKAEMNYLLKFVLHRIRAWLPNTITHTMAQEDRPDWLTDSELTWRANQLFFEHRDMSVIEVNLNTEYYTVLAEFLADVLSVQHNVALFHGTDSQEYQATEFVVKDTMHDLMEIKNCADCYRHSNEKINTKWFTLPCRDPHELVWAKQKGYSYWPAKVMRESSTHCDVRFFGGKHERAYLHKSFIKPITVAKESLKIKPISTFNKAYEELAYHQKLLSDPEELERVKADGKPKKIFKQKVLFSSHETNATNPPLSPVKGKKRSLVTDEKPDIKKLHLNIEDKTSSSANTSSNANEISGNIINISDCEDEESSSFSFRGSTLPQESFSYEDTCYEQVTSSTENCNRSPSQETGMQQLDQPYSDAVEKMRRRLESLTTKKEIIRYAMESMQTEIDRVTNNHNDHLKRLFESHNAQISETKKKQWCYNCEQDAIYHCCWNTAYCSQTCQQQHWQSEHKKVCRRKRQT